MTKNKLIAGVIVFLFFVWGGISYNWYACGIKDVCDNITINNQIN